jgi:hypothetical protein
MKGIFQYLFYLNFEIIKIFIIIFKEQIVIEILENYGVYCPDIGLIINMICDK